MARREEQRAAPRIPDLINFYVEQHLPRLSPRNASDQVSMLRNLVEPEWKTRLVADITPDDVARLPTKIAEGRARPAKEKAKSRGSRELQGSKPTPIRANRTGEVMRKMFSLSVRPWKMRDDNPAEGFLRRAETERERFLSLEEVDRLANALAAADDRCAAALIRMCILTGARLGEVRLARSSSSISTSASGPSRPRRPSSARSTGCRSRRTSPTIVRLRRAAAPADCPWLFPGDVEGQPLQDIRRFWNSIQTTAELPDVRMHDLRHTFASMLAGRGASLARIGKLLGPAQAKTTQRYAHLADQPLRAGVDEVAALMRPKPKLVVRNWASSSARSVRQAGVRRRRIVRSSGASPSGDRRMNHS